MDHSSINALAWEWLHSTQAGAVALPFVRIEDPVLPSLHRELCRSLGQIGHSRFHFVGGLRIQTAELYCWADLKLKSTDLLDGMQTLASPCIGCYTYLL